MQSRVAIVCCHDAELFILCFGSCWAFASGKAYSQSLYKVSNCACHSACHFHCACLSKYVVMMRSKEIKISRLVPHMLILSLNIITHDPPS
jgi:hypothetical protein